MRFVAASLLLGAALHATSGLTLAGAASLPADCRVELTLAAASWLQGKEDDRADVTLYLDRCGGSWARRVDGRREIPERRDA